MTQPTTTATTQMSTPRIAFYSHDTMGLGHLRRNILIASVLADAPVRADVLVISGAREACHFAMQAGVDCLTVPSLCKGSDGEYAGKFLRWTCEQTTRLRSRVIASALEAFSPDLFIVDKVPRGVANELDVALSELLRQGKARCILGLREILDDPITAIRQWQECDADRTIRDHYHEIWIYGDPCVYDSVRHYRFKGVTAERSFYTGYLNQTRRVLGAEASPFQASDQRSVAVCTVGGGQDGSRLALAFAAAPMPPGWRGFLITGPFLPEADRQRIRQLIGTRSDCTLIEELVEADRYIARADKVISMAGYNTITSILSFAKPALVVPRILPRQEQWIRASQLAGRGLLTLMEPSQLSPTAIGNWIAERNVPTPQTDSVDLGGLERIANRVLRWLPRHCSPMSNFRREIAVV